LRVVLDTNILISACWKADSLEARVLQLVTAGALAAFVSEPVLAEYREVLARDKFRSRADCLAALLARVETLATRVTPTESLHAALDEDDNRLLECAAAAQADFLITGNLRDFPERWPPTRIVNARQLLAEWERR
jgi:uncharacterized protein